jgi:pilus assembly protein CpaC
VLPRFDPESSEIQVNLGAEVIDLVPPITDATNLPGQNTSDLSTAAALKLGQSLVLSGIRSETQRRNKVGIPGLSAIPILGLLFGSLGMEREDVEGAVFIIPSVIENVSPRASELIERTFREFQAFDGDMSDVTPFDERAPEARVRVQERK